jgi:hypothetical protein
MNFSLVNINVPINVAVQPSVQTGLNLAVLSPSAVQLISQGNQAGAGFFNLNLN